MMNPHSGRDPNDEAISRYVRDGVARYEVPSSVLAGSIRRRERGERLGIAARATLVLAIVIFAIAVFRPFSNHQAPVTGAQSELSSPSASVPASAPIAPSPTAPTATSSAAPDLGGYAWFEITLRGPCPNGVVSEPLSDCADPTAPKTATIVVDVATLDGREHKIVTRTLTGMSQPQDLERAMPAAVLDGRRTLFYTANDGHGGALRRLAPADGTDTEEYRSPDLITDLAYDRSDGTVLVALVSAAKRVDRGVWRVDPATGSTSQVLAPRTDLDMSIHANGWQRRIYVTPDGALLVTLDCLAGKCEEQAFDARTGSRVSEAAGLRDEIVYGVTTDALVGIFDCPQYPCRISALDLHTGDLRVLGTPCPGSTAALSDGLALLGVGPAPTACAAGTVSVISVADGGAAGAATETGGEVSTVERGPTLGYSAPSGWIALGPGGGFRPAAGETAGPQLLNLIDGTLAPIPLVTPWAR